MKFKKGYYGKQCYSISDISQLYKHWAICINILVVITKFNSFNQIVIIIHTCNRMWYNLHVVDRSRVGIGDHDIFNVFVFVSDILMNVSISLSSSNVLTMIFIEIASNSDKQSEFECDCGNNGQATVITNDFHKIHITPIVVGVFVDVFHFILQAMDTSSLNVALPIEFEAFIVGVVAIAQLILNFAVSLSVTTVSSHTQVINVCVFPFRSHLFVIF